MPRACLFMKTWTILSRRNQQTLVNDELKKSNRFSYSKIQIHFHLPLRNRFHPFTIHFSFVTLYFKIAMSPLLFVLCRNSNEFHRLEFFIAARIGIQIIASKQRTVFTLQYIQLYYHAMVCSEMEWVYVIM